VADTNLEQLKRVLDELFMFDRADLDFGLYRVMNVKREEIRAFRDTRLLPLVHEALGERLAGEQAALRGQIDAKERELRADGQDPGASVALRELRGRYDAIPDIETSEAEVYAHLTSFFRRYYKEGDFISLRRYKEGVYAIPYEGEEVKLHWANADQYYIKTTEQFRDYTFLLPDGRRVHFKLVQADTPENNNRAQAGKDRRFVLSGKGDEDGAPLTDAVIEVDGELLVRFEYRPDGSGRSQKVLDALTVETVTEALGAKAWTAALNAPARDDSTTGLLAKHVAAYTAKNTFDYFIHKDLGGFLRRELDFYLKNEVLHLDDIDTGMSDGGTLERHLRTLKAIRRVATPIIEFLASLEEFQKRLWLKQKFVVDTHWCVTLDRVPHDLYPEVAANGRQREEWVHLFAIDSIAGDMMAAGYSVPLTEAFLIANPFLVLDTSLFEAEFTERLLSSIDDLDATTDGLLVHSENFQALNLMQARYREQVQCVYIDPPYNTGSSTIPYKNDYKHSSWVTMMRDRLAAIRPVMKASGAIFVSIDKLERTVLEHALDTVFGAENRIQELIWSMNTNNGQAPNYSTNHEYVFAYAKERVIAELNRAMFREPKPGFEEVMELVATLNPTYPPVATIEKEIHALYARHRIEYREQVENQGLEWSDEAGNDPWKGLFNYSHAEYRDTDGTFVREAEAQARGAVIWVWQEDNTSMPATKQSPTTAQAGHRNYRYYTPLHPVTGKPTPHPKSGWKFAYDDDEDSPDRRSFVSLDRDHRIAWGVDENKVPRLKRMLHEVETNVGKSVFQDYSDGEKQTSAMFGRSGVFLAPKHADFVSRFILHAAAEDEITLDCFGGSGSTAHAVLRLNRADRKHRKFILVEVGEYFDTVLKPRVLKAVHSAEWRNGKPLGRQGVSQLIKVIRLESYEDTLNNLQVRPQSERQERLLADGGPAHEAFRDEYTLRYWVEQETRGSASLLDITHFDDPWGYHLDVGQGSAAETRPTTVDLVETFNYLLGLRVQQVDRVAGVLKVVGMLPPSAGRPAGEKALVIWRDTHQVDAVALDKFLDTQRINSRDLEYDVIYVNGDNHIENTRRSDETWKVRLIEDEFQRLMFETAEQERR